MTFLIADEYDTACAAIHDALCQKAHHPAACLDFPADKIASGLASVDVERDGWHTFRQCDHSDCGEYEDADLDDARDEGFGDGLLAINRVLREDPGKWVTALARCAQGDGWDDAAVNTVAHDMAEEARQV